VPFKQPRSIQVVIFADSEEGRRYLLLKRVLSFGGFWQSVTGSLEEEETHKQAATREVCEETGVSASEDDLIELGIVNTFEIAPQWRSRYGPDVTHNEEVCFALRITKRDIKLDPLEHESWWWVPYEQAMEMLYWESNRRALVAADALAVDHQVREVRNK
jgi:NTP pyrophosphohydrolases including oxidative damage repair enzymes